MSSKANKANHAPANAQDSWSRVRLGDICEIVRGVTYKKDQAGEQPAKGMLPILRATNIQDNALVLACDLVYVPSDVVSEEQMLRIGDIVVATSSGSKHLVGKTAQIKESWAGSFGAFCAVLRPNADIDHRYLGYFFGSQEYKDYISKKALGVNINNLRRGDLEEISVPVAPLDQQKHIVAAIEKQFSRLDEAVANLKRVKASLKRYKAAVLKAAVEGRLVETEAELARREGRNYETGAQLLQRILETRRRQWKGKGKYQEPAAPDITDLPELSEGWVWAVSDVIFDFITSGSRGWAKYYSDSGSIFIRVGNLDHGTIELDLSEVQHVSAPGNPEAERSRVSVGDLLISITAELGMVAVVPEHLGEAYINQHVAIARSTDLVDKNYIGWYFACENAGKKQLESLRRGATKAGLGLDDIRSVYIALPPLSEQRRIVAEVDRRFSLVREVESQNAANFKRAERLRHSILQTAFSGRLVLEDPNTEPALALMPRVRARAGAEKTSKMLQKSGEQATEKETIMSDLVEALKSAGGWITAQEAFRRCGVADGADTDTIEKMYAELRDHIKPGFIQIERRDDEDWLRLAASQGADHALGLVLDRRLQESQGRYGRF